MNQAKREMQLNAWLKKNRRMAEEAKSENERDYILSIWAGFLSGLRMTNAITQKDYNAYYDELRSLIEELETQRA